MELLEGVPVEVLEGVPVEVLAVALEAAGAPGTPGWTPNEGGEPIGGAAFAGWEANHVRNDDGLRTRTVERISE